MAKRGGEAWWRKHHEASPDMFSRELRSAVRLLQTAPELGLSYDPYAGRRVRRIILEHTRYHVYYREPQENEVEIIEVWSALRERGPKL